MPGCCDSGHAGQAFWLPAALPCPGRDTHALPWEGTRQSGQVSALPVGPLSNTQRWVIPMVPQLLHQDTAWIQG